MKNKTTLLMVGIIVAVSMLSAAGLSIMPVQQASANLIGEDGDGDTDFSFKQEQKNKCSGSAYCSNYGEINFGFPDM
jgi:hypothetical protein